MVTRRAFIGIVGSASAAAGLIALGALHDEWASRLMPPAKPVVPTSDAPPVSATMPTGDVVSNGTTWRPTLSEDFLTDAAPGAVLATYPRMNAYKNGADTSGHGTYAPQKVLSVSDSMLDFHLRTEHGRHLVAAVLPDDYRRHEHGRVQIRYRADPVSGYKFVGLLWPSSNVWNDGEIDWPEGDLDARARPASAIAGSRNLFTRAMSFAPAEQVFAGTDQSGFHVATTEWTAEAIRFYWDDDMVAEVNTGIPTKPMRVTLQAETWLGHGEPPDSADGHVEIDWIVIYDVVDGTADPAGS